MEELLTLLKHISSGDTNAVNAATFKLANMYKNPLSIVALIDICCSNQELSLRQLAAIEARKHVSVSWPKIEGHLKQTLKDKLLNFVLVEGE
jgi:hypothetical protein